VNSKRASILLLVCLLASTASCGGPTATGGNAAAPANANAAPSPPAFVDASSTLPYDLVAVDFVSEASGWIVGNDAGNNVSVILRTVNGGATWIAVLEVIGDTLLDVDFVDDQTGYAVGAEGVAYRTSDGGQNWQEVPATTWKSQRSVEAVSVSPKSGDAAGSQLRISESIASMFFLDAKTGWAAGDTPTGDSVNVRGLLLGTTNGGATWTELTSPHGGPAIASAVNDIFFVSATEGWAACGSLEEGEEDLLLHTRDGGRTWERQNVASAQYVRAVHFTSPQRGYAVGLTTDEVSQMPGPSKLLETSDGGATWKVALVADRSFYDITFSGARRGWAVGDRATVYTTTDGGATWRQQAKFQMTGAKRLQRPPRRPGVESGRGLRTVWALDPVSVWLGGEGEILRGSVR